MCIHGAVLLVWVLLFMAALGAGGVLAWSVGLAYVLYDTVLLVFTFQATWRLTRPATLWLPDSPGGHAEFQRLGVIVAAHNEASVLPVTLAALFAQTEPAAQIVVADDGSTDATATLLQERYGLAVPELGALSSASATHPGLHWLRLPHGGKARALNAAIVGMDVELVLTVDADTLLEPAALSALRGAFQADRRLVAATGVLSPVCGPGISGRLLQWFQTYEYIRNFLSRYAWMRADGLLLISGAFAGFQRAALLQVGGFDPDCLVEDYELIHRLRRFGALHGLGWTTEVIGGARGRTEAPSTLLAFVRQRRRWFGGFLQTQYWYRDMVGNARFGAVGTRMLPVKAIDTLQPLYGLAALLILLINLYLGRLPVIIPVAGVIGAKILIDFAFHCWSVHVYRRWVGDVTSASFAYALLAALAEPFSFQILRHTSAALGWGVFLTGNMRWGRQHRVGLISRD